MSFLEEIIANMPPEILSGFGRLAVANEDPLFSAKRINADLVPVFFDETEVTGGSGTSYVYDKPNARAILGVSNLTAGTRVLQSKQRFNYQSGHAQKIVMSYNFNGHDTGIVKRYGYFDGENGAFLQSDVNGYHFGIMKNGSVTLIDEADWIFSWGTFPAIPWADRGITLDPDKLGIFILDMEWLGSGSIRFGFQLNSAPVWAHADHSANVATTVHMQTPNLPVRAEITNDGTGPAATFDVICQSVASDGGVPDVGESYSVSRGASLYSTGNNTSIHPVLSFRLRTNYTSAVVTPLSLSVINNSNTRFRYGLVANPTVAGVDAASWVVNTYTAIEYDISRTNVNTLSGGFELFSYEADGRSDSPPINTKSVIRPGFYLDPTTGLTGVSDEYVVFVQNKTGSSSYGCSVVLEEAE